MKTSPEFRPAKILCDVSLPGNELYFPIFGTVLSLAKIDRLGAMARLWVKTRRSRGSVNPTCSGAMARLWENVARQKLEPVGQSKPRRHLSRCFKNKCPIHRENLHMLRLLYQRRGT